MAIGPNEDLREYGISIAGLVASVFIGAGAEPLRAIQLLDELTPCDIVDQARTGMRRAIDTIAEGLADGV